MKTVPCPFSIRPTNHRLWQSLVLSICAACLLTGKGLAAELQASAVLRTCANRPISIGQAFLSERRSAEGVKVVDVVVQVSRGLPPGRHAVHIHETGDCTPCDAAGGHFDPGPNSNPSPDGNHPFHSGDLINLDINRNGAGVLFTTTSRVRLSTGRLSLFDEDGSAFIIHVDPDTYCPNGAVPGCAGGARAACGIIRRLRQ